MSNHYEDQQPEGPPTDRTDDLDPAPEQPEKGPNGGWLPIKSTPEQRQRKALDCCAFTDVVKATLTVRNTPPVEVTDLNETPEGLWYTAHWDERPTGTKADPRMGETIDAPIINSARRFRPWSSITAVTIVEANVYSTDVEPF